MRPLLRLLLLTAFLPVPAFAQGNGKLQIHYVSAGEGDAAVVVSPRGEVVLFDSGAEAQCGMVVSYLQSLGVTGIDYQITSDFQPDHIGCTTPVLSLFPLRQAAFDPGGAEPSREYVMYERMAAGRRRTPAPGETITLDESSGNPVTITFVGLGAQGSGARWPHPLVAVVRLGAFEAVFGGDLNGEAPASEALIAPAVGQVEVYKVHGHGHSRSSSRLWLATVAPKVGVISTGAGNTHGNPGRGALDRLHAARVDTYWTSPGNGASPDPTRDRVAGDTVVEFALGDASFSVTAGSTTKSYQLWGVTASAAPAGPPFGTVDTPAPGATVAGELPFTGWALDDSGISSVEVYRAPMANEPVQANGLVFVGTATIVDGARPDVAALFPAYPGNTRAGWGLMILSNMLPNLGNGTFTIYAYAKSVAGETQLIGSRSVIAANATSASPFGTIDTPAQGATVSGVMVNFGWALTPKPNAIATDGSTIDVYVDSVFRGHPVYNAYRSDIATLFPGLANSNGAVGYFVLDTTQLANGVHTIAWVLRDNAGNSQGVGSRFFTVQNTLPAPAVVLRSASETAFNAANQPLVIDITGATVSSVNNVSVFRNSQPVAKTSIQLSGNAITVTGVLSEGKNDFTVMATAAGDVGVYGEFTLWAGSRTLTGTLKDENGLLVPNASVRVQLGDDKRVTGSATTTAGGAFSIPNVPDRTVFVTASGTENRLVWASTLPSAGAVALQFKAFAAASGVENNDFSLGLGGWDTSKAAPGKVTIVTHVESSLSADGLEIAATSPNSDLRLETSGQGPQTVTRTFASKAGIKSVTVRFKFVTSEVPGGYYGTEFNDSYVISLRAKIGGGSAVEALSMNELGLGAFSAQGATGWRELTLPVNETVDIVEASVTVSNVADGLLDSYLLVDGLGERKLLVRSHSLLDIDNTELKYLSADPSIPDSYLGGFSHVNGKIVIEGAETDGLQALTLEIGQEGRIVAVAELAPEAQAALIKPFGSARKVEITTAQRLFRLTKTEAGKVNGASDSTLTLTLRARSTAGEEAVAEVGSVPLLVRYQGTNRYFERNELEGGDDWAVPRLRDLVTYFTTIMTGSTWGDFSNMHGGKLDPHSSHTKGIDVDGDFTAFSSTPNKAVADELVRLLNDPVHGGEIETVWVTFQETATDTFYNAIKDVTLQNQHSGKAATSVIKNWPGHTGHFHWRIKE